MCPVLFSPAKFTCACQEGSMCGLKDAKRLNDCINIGQEQRILWRKEVKQGCPALCARYKDNMSG